LYSTPSTTTLGSVELEEPHPVIVEESAMIVSVESRVEMREDFFIVFS
jgi:hypothetical protein